jgi:hypothetical protein
MEEISRSVRQAKQAKFWDADCTCPYSPYGDVAGPYDRTGGDVVHFGWLLVGELDVDTCLIGSEWYEDTWPNAWAPRVPRWLAYNGYVKLMEATGFDPRTSHHTYDFTISANHYADPCSLFHIPTHIYLN